ncbi:MAG: hypothetical protein ACJA1E_001035 [Paracoccaceae bacterium]|jgi:hypothetical protein
MPITPQRDQQLARQGRLVAIVIAAAFLLWIAANWLGGVFGLPVKYAFLFDFAALGAMIWSFIVAYRIWRERRG